MQNTSDPDTIGVKLNVQGQGFWAVDVIEYGRLPLSSRYEPQQVTRLWDGVVDLDPRAISLRFKPHINSVAFRIMLRKMGRAKGEINLSDVKICRRHMPTYRFDDPQNDQAFKVVPVSRWIPSDFVVGCKREDGQMCQFNGIDTFVRKIRSDHVQFWGQLSQISSRGFEPGFGFRLRTRLEHLREFFESYPESTLTRALSPVYDRVMRHAAPEGYQRYRLNMRLTGQGRYSAYVQYTLPTGVTDWVYAGEVAVEQNTEKNEFEFSLPKGAGQFEFVMTGGAQTLILKDATLERLEPQSAPPASQTP
jgi:hypothetical protein